MTKLIENEPESQSWLEGRARRRRERIKSERAFLRTKQHRETTKIQNRGSNPLGFFSTSMSPSRATLDQKHGPSSLPHAFCFFLLLFFLCFFFFLFFSFSLFIFLYSCILLLSFFIISYFNLLFYFSNVRQFRLMN